MNKNDLIRSEFLKKYQYAQGGFHFAMDDDTDELICLWNIDNQEIADNWIESVMNKFNLQVSKEKTGVYRLWW
jgi:hypothetical protein